MERPRVAVVGVGHLGKEHARILAQLPEAELVGVVDVQAEQAQAVARRCGTRAITDYRTLLNEVDAAVIAAPTCHHAAIAAEFLQHGVSLLVEKPLASTLAQAEQLVDLAERHGALLQVGHIERFNPAFEELCQRTFQPRFIEGERLGPFTGRSTDIGVVLDLMIHDLDLILALTRSTLTSVEALGVSVFGGQEDVADARLTFANGCVAHLRASRASYTVSRRMNIWSPEGFLAADWAARRVTLVQPSEQVRRNGLDPRQFDAGARTRLRDELFDHHLQVLELDRNTGDQLTMELRHFVHCVRTGTTPRVTGADGRNAIAAAARVLEKIQSHRWNGEAAGPQGPLDLPVPLGRLFQLYAGEAAA